MNSLKQRPFAFSCFLFVITALLLFATGMWIKIAISAVCLLTVFVLFSNKRKYSFCIIYLLPPIILACVVSLVAYNINYKNILTYSDKTVECEFTVREETVGENYSLYVVDVTKINEQKTNFKSKIYYDGKLESPLFKEYSAKLKFYKQKSLSEDVWSFSNGVFLGASLNDEPTEIRQTKPIPLYWFYKINEAFSSLTDKNISGEESNLIQALILGNKENLSNQTTENFRSLGMSHMLAVSGLHLSLLIGSIGKFLENKSKMGKKSRYLFMICLTFAYAGITGFSPSVKRAAFMLILCYASFFVSKRADAITSLCSAFAFICLLSPYSLFDIGLWLSFLATYGILQVGGSPEDIQDEDYGLLKKAFKKLSSALLLGIVPIMFSLPVLWLSFGEIAILSPIMNILFALPLYLLMCLSPFAMIFANVPFLSNFLAVICEFVAHIMLISTDFLADFSPVININYDFTYIIVIFLVVSIAILVVRNTKNKLLYFIPLALSVIVFIVLSSIYSAKTADDRKIIYSQTYYGESFLVISENKALLCDASGMSYANAIESYLQMKDCHISRLDGYMVTNYSEKGIQTLENLTSLTKIKSLYVPFPSNSHEEILKKAFSEYALNNNIILNVYDPNREKSLNFFGIDISVYTQHKPQNDSSSAVSISFSGEGKTYNYIGSTASSRYFDQYVVTDWFLNEEYLIFGSGCQEDTVDTLPILYQQNKKLFFANNALFALFNKTIPNDSEITILDEYFVFSFN